MIAPCMLSPGIAGLAASLATALTCPASLNSTQAGLLGCGLLIVLLVCSMPVGFAMAVAGLVGYAVAVKPSAAMSMAAMDLYATFTSWSLTVIPLFIFMGQVAFHSGISRRLFQAAHCWLGHWRGGMAMATVGACAGFGAICGSGPATAATMASVALPEMKRYRYNMGLATGTIASAGGLGMLIPPSVVFIVYAVQTQQSIGRLFIAGIVPGLVVAALFCLTIHLLCRWRPDLGPAGDPAPWPRRFASLLGVSETLLLFLLVMGGMFMGFFTPTEAAAVGAGGSLIIAGARGNLSVNMLQRCLLETLRTGCMVFVIIAGAEIFGKFLTITQIPQNIAEWLANPALPRWGTLTLILAFYLLAGCFVDALALVLLTVPVFFPVIKALGYDPVWFGVMIVVVTQMGVISPPVGVNVYVVNGIARDVPLQRIFKGTLPFLLALVASAAVLAIFPSISLWLPEMVK